MAHSRSFFRILSVLSLVPVIASGCGLFPSGTDPVQPPNTGSFSQHPVRVNSVGYVPERGKRATIVLPSGMSTLPDTMVELRDAGTDSVAWTGTAQGPMTDSGTASTDYIVDFGAFTSTGTFYLAVPSLKAGDTVATSTTFRIASDVFRDVLTRSMLGLYGQRCGSAVDISLNSEHWTHAACHTGDASQKFLPSIMMDTIKPSLHGWHDAGDYGKYTTNGAFTVGMMLQAYERFQPTLSALELPIPEKGGAIPDFLDEVKWELDWLLTTQSEDGSVSFKVTAQTFEGNVVPEKDGSRRFYTDISTAATGDFAAVFAQAARIYRPYDSALADSYLAAARLSYGFLKANAAIKPNLDMFATGGYDANSGDSDNRAWAAAEMWETTGEDSFLADFEGTPKAPKIVSDNFDYADVANMGSFTYVLSSRAGRDQTVLDATTASVLASAERLSTRAGNAAFGRAIENYWWGSNGALVRTAMNLWTAGMLSPADAPRYSDAIAMQLDWLLGRNIYDRTQVTGVGYHPPIDPHHRPSQADATSSPWPGLLVGGPNPDADNMAPPGNTWKDSSSMYNVNEVAINWSGALIYAAAALVPTP